MQIENVCDKGFVGRNMMHFKTIAPITRSTENFEVSMTQFQKRESTGFRKMQGLSVLANICQPKLTVSAFVILQVFDSLIRRVRVDIHQVVNSLTRIFDVHAKVRNLVR